MLKPNNCLNPSIPHQPKNMVTRIYTTVCFWHPCAKTPHVLSFFNDQFLHQKTKSFKSLFLHLACGRHVSLRHVVAIDPLIDSIPESSIDGWASAVLHLTGAIFFEVVPTTINLLVSCNFRLSSYSHLLSPFTTHVDHRLHNVASVQERYINVAWRSSASVHGRY